MIYKMTLKDSSDTMTFNLLETPIVDKDIEGAVDNVTLDGNQYTDYLYLKKQYIQKWAIMCPDEYDELRGFYTRQFEEGEIPSYRVYYGANVTKDYIYNESYFQFNAKGLETGMYLSQLTGNAEQTTYSGKNLLNLKKFLTDNGVSYTENSDGSLTFTLIQILHNNRFVFSDSDITISASAIITNGTSSNALMDFYDSNNNRTGRLSTSVSKIENIQASYMNLNWGNVGTVTIKDGMVNTGSTALPYEPFVGGIPAPNPDYPQPISTVTGAQTVKIARKNLLSLVPYRTGSDWYNLSAGAQVVPATSTNIVLAPITNGVQATLSSGWQGAWYICEVAEGQTYTFKYTQSGTNARTTTYTLDENHTIVRKIAPIASDNYTYQSNITMAEGEKYFALAFGASSNGSVVELTEPQLELGSTATDYEPYHGQEFPIDLYEPNFFDISRVISDSNGYLVNNGDGTLSVNGFNRSGNSPYNLADYCPNLQAGDEVVLDAKTTGTRAYIYLNGSNYQWDFGTKRTITATDLASRVGFYSTASGTVNTISNIIIAKPIELAKIGTYQDRIYKDSDKWYIEKQIGKYNLAKSGMGWVANSGRNVFYTALITDYKISNNVPLCSIASGHTNVTGLSGMESDTVPNNSCAFINQSGSTTPRFYVKTTSWDSWTDGVVYYALATPTTTEITDETLLSQLNFIASLYEGVNNISLVGTGAQGEMEVLIRDVLDVERDVVPETPVRLTLTDGGVINACGCRRDVQLTMRETTE